MQVLIVDDSDPVRARLRDMLADALPGTTIREASCGREALAQVRDGAGMDVVLLDLHLAAEDGLAVLTEMRAASAAVLVVLTNDASEHHRRECTARGASFFFDKSRQFDRAVDVIVEHARAMHEA